MTKLKTFRQEKKLTQKRLAEVSGVGVRSVEKYESRERDINKAQAIIIYKLAKAVDRSMEELLEL